jgi:nitrous-oxide reductase
MKHYILKSILPLLLGSMGLLSMQGCKPKGTQSAVSGDAASKVYVAPGKYDEFYNFVSGGFSGQMSVYGYSGSFLYSPLILKKVGGTVKKQSLC